MTPALPGQRSVLDNDKFWPGNRPIWDMKEGRVSSRYPDLIKALRRESDPSQRRQILAGHKTRIFGSSGGTVQEKAASQRMRESSNIRRIQELVRSTDNV